MVEKKTNLKLHKERNKKEKLTTNQVTSFLKKQNAAYVLLTCSEPSESGQMQAELSYSGDETLVSYLIDSAQHIFSEESISLKDSC